MNVSFDYYEKARVELKRSINLSTMTHGKYYVDRLWTRYLVKLNNYIEMPANGNIEVADIERQMLENELVRLKRNEGDTPQQRADKMKIWVSPFCSIPRDMIRLNYRIVRDKKDADIILLSHTENVTTTWPQVFIMITDDVGKKHLFDLYFYDQHSSSSIDISSLENNDEIVEAAKAKLKDELIDCRCMNVVDIYEYWCDKGIYKKYYYGCPESSELICQQKTYPDKYYIEQHSLPMDMPNEINIDTLEMLYHCNDFDIVQRTIISSNWQEYPFTLWKLLASKLLKKKSFASYKPCRAMIDAYQKMIGSKNGLIEPKDYNMLQDFILRLAGVNKRGFITEEGEDMLKRAGLLRFIPRRIAIQKVDCDIPLTENELTQWG